MNQLSAVDARKRNARRAILAFDLVLLLFPPVYWLAGAADSVASLWYFLGGNLLAVLSLFALWALREEDADDAADVRTDSRLDTEEAR